MGDSKEGYNSIPVYYCKKCLSLKIKTVPGMEGLDYCEECGATNVESTDIETWRQQYRDKYGLDYLDKF